MSLLEVAKRQTKKSDMSQKVSYAVFLNTVTGEVEGDPDAYFEIHGAPNQQMFYLFVRGAYVSFAGAPVQPPNALSISAGFSLQGSIVAPPAAALANAGAVVQYCSYFSGDPNSITVPNDYAMFMFSCQRAENGNCFVPSVGIYVTIEFVAGVFGNSAQLT